VWQTARVQAVFKHLGVVAWLGILSALVLRSHAGEDERWGFSMFGDIQLTRVTWEWERVNGRRTPLNIRKYLRGDARLLAPVDGRETEWNVGPGALRSELLRLSQWFMNEEHPRGKGRVVVTLEMSAWRVEPWIAEEIVWPPRDVEL
jgi:hypothetical protein